MTQQRLMEWEKILSACQQLSACLDVDRLRQQVTKISFSLFDCEAVLWISGGADNSRVSAVYPSSRKEARSISNPQRFIPRAPTKVCIEKLNPAETIPPFVVETMVLCKIGDSSQDHLIIINPTPELTTQDIEKLFAIIEKQILLQNQMIRHLDAAQRKALTDDLTGLYNVRYFQEVIESEWKRGVRYNTPFSLLFIDLDEFKVINDKYGHLTGSAIIQEIAEIIKAGVRNVDSVFRYGGDEFTVVLPNCSAKDAEIVKERIQLMIKKHKFSSSEGKSFSLTASVGIASFPTDGDRIQQLIESADRSMYQEKFTQLATT